jgi:hypothetical protein
MAGYFYSMRGTLFAVVFACAVVGLVASDAHGNVSGMDVTVSDAAGRLVYRGKTDAAGAFGTGRVAPGVYVVQLNAKKVALDRNDYGIFAAGGTHRVVADAVEGAKFASGGVAMRLKLKTATPIIGQVALGGTSALGTKIVDGTRYILMAPQTGSNIGPRWVEEGTQPARNVTRLRTDVADELYQIKSHPTGNQQ